MYITNRRKKHSLERRMHQSRKIKEVYDSDSERRRVSPGLGHASRYIREGKMEKALNYLIKLEAERFIIDTLGYPSVEEWVESRNHKIIRVENMHRATFMI